MAASPKPQGGGEVAGPSPVNRLKKGMKRSQMVEGAGIRWTGVLAGAHWHDSPLLAPTMDKLNGLGPLPDDITVHLDSGYDSAKTRDELADRGLRGHHGTFSAKPSARRVRPGTP